MNRTEVAALFGVSTETIATWVKDGMPSVSRGRAKASEYDIAACVQWRRARDLAKSEVAGNIDEERLRKTRAEADKLEFELSVQQGAHVPVDVLTNTLNGEFGRIRAKMLGVASKITPTIKPFLRDEKEIVKVFDLVMGEIRLVLEQAAEEDDENYDAIDGDGCEVQENPVAAKKPERKPVGRPKGISKPRRLG